MRNSQMIVSDNMLLLYHHKNIFFQILGLSVFCLDNHPFSFVWSSKTGQGKALLYSLHFDSYKLIEKLKSYSSVKQKYPLCERQGGKIVGARGSKDNARRPQIPRHIGTHRDWATK